jgi:hypothetical protein
LEAGLTEPTTPIRGSAEAVVEASRPLEVVFDIAETRTWMEAVSRVANEPPRVEAEIALLGQRMVAPDRTPIDLARYRHISQIIRIDGQRPGVHTAMVLSSATGLHRARRPPGDCDFFERIHIEAPTRDEAYRVLADLMRNKAISRMRGPGYRLEQVMFGSWPVPAHLDRTTAKPGEPVSWTPEQVRAGSIKYLDREERARELSWDDVAPDPGWCRLDWVLADPDHGAVASGALVVDATWEDPGGTLIPLDAFLDPYLQEVQSEVDSIPLFARPTTELTADSLSEYVERLADEVYTYTTKQADYARVARRLYNIFRLTGRWDEAAHIRALFDESLTALCQVASLLRVADEASETFRLDAESLLVHFDQLIVSAVAALEAGANMEFAQRLLRLRTSVNARESIAAAFAEEVRKATADILEAVDRFFERSLIAMPEIAWYLAALADSRSGR